MWRVQAKGERMTDEPENDGLKHQGVHVKGATTPDQVALVQKLSRPIVAAVIDLPPGVMQNVIGSVILSMAVRFDEPELFIGDLFCNLWQAAREASLEREQSGSAPAEAKPH